MAGVEGASRRSKLTKVMNGSVSISDVCVSFFEKYSQVHTSSRDLYSRVPFTVPLSKRNAFVRTASAGNLCSIFGILTRSARSEIVTCIVKAVSVFVVVLTVFLVEESFHNFSVHIDASSMQFSNGTPTVSIAGSFFSGEPFETRDEVEIALGNSGEFTLSQHNPTSTFFHSSSFSGRCCFPDAPARFLPSNQN